MKNKKREDIKKERVDMERENLREIEVDEGEEEVDSSMGNDPFDEEEF